MISDLKINSQCSDDNKQADQDDRPHIEMGIFVGVRYGHNYIRQRFKVKKAFFLPAYAQIPLFIDPQAWTE